MPDAVLRGMAAWVVLAMARVFLLIAVLFFASRRRVGWPCPGTGPA
jgi:hypothetical protein